MEIKTGINKKKEKKREKKEHEANRELVESEPWQTKKINDDEERINETVA